MIVLLLFLPPQRKNTLNSKGKAVGFCSLFTHIVDCEAAEWTNMPLTNLKLF